ncbi:MAG: hypothetical protein IIB28_04155 [Chloroflexi bacterium]|nr:hypothetical protein [Chloroflexota bacterium]
MGKGNLILNLRRLWPLALGAFVLAGTACEALATQSARDAVETGRQVRELEDTEIRPLEDELRALIENEIEPLQDELEDLFFQEREIEETVLRPLWESQEDPWAPGGELFVAQQEFEAKFQDIERQYREIELEERKLQNHFNGGGFDAFRSPESQVLEDTRYELQRELDQLYRRGWAPVEEIYGQINLLSQAFNWADPNTNDRVNEINDKINALYHEASQAQQNVDGAASDTRFELDEINNELNNLYNWGRGPIDDLYRQIEDEKFHLSESGADAFGVEADISSLEADIAFLESQLDSILSGLYNSRNTTEADLNFVLAAYDSDIAVLEAEISQLSSSTGTAASPDPALVAALEALNAELQSELDIIAVIRAEAEVEINALIEDEDAIVGPLLDQSDALELELIEVDDGTASTTDVVLALEAELFALEDEIGAIYSVTDSAIAVIEADRDSAVAPHQARVDEINVEIADAAASLDTTSAITLSDDSAAQIDSLEGEISDLRLLRDAEAEPYYMKLVGIDRSIDEESSFWQSQIEIVRLEIDGLLRQSSGVAGSADDSFLQSLISQVADMEQEYQAQINKLEDRRSTLDAQVNNLYSTDPAQHIYEKIDELNVILYQIAEESGSTAQGNQRQIEELQRKAFEMEEALKNKTRALEDDLWSLDDELQDFYRSSELNMRDVQGEMDAAFKGLQSRRFELDDARFAIESEMKGFFNSFDDGRPGIESEVKRLRAELLQPIRIRIREIEIRLKDLRKEARGLERRIRAAEHSVDGRRRDLENDVFDLLERAIGVSEALTGDGLLTGEVPATTDDSLFGDEPAAEDGSAVAPATDPVIDLSVDADGAPTDPVAVE